jgi:hypothetical protein
VVIACGTAAEVGRPQPVSLSGAINLRDAPNLGHLKTASGSPLPSTAQGPLPSTTPSPGALASAAPLGPASPRQPGASRSAAPTQLRVAWGVVEDGWPGNRATLDSLESLVNRRAELLQSYIHWGGGWGEFADVAPSLQAALDHGSIPVVTWLSGDPTVADQSAYAPRLIAAGAFDGYLSSWAAGLRSLGSTVFLRFDPEMNGNWTDYSAGVAGTTADEYVSAWRHIHDVFESAGATNVRWVWSPNVEYNGSTSLSSLYPGDGYVDWVALDGYNWGSTNGKAWQSFSQVFDRSLADLRALTGRPLMLAEVGSSPIGGDKAAWISDMFAQLRSHPEIRAFIWFDLNKETDWRIQSSAASARAFAAGLAGTQGFSF